jgi:hypothetical protein
MSVLEFDFYLIFVLFLSSNIYDFVIAETNCSIDYHWNARYAFFSGLHIDRLTIILYNFD